jgi:ABC-type transport system substrate-binding protein
LRDGVKFHDGSPLTADAVIWNLDRVYNEKSPQFDAPASAIVRSFVNMLDRYQKIDDRTIAIWTKSPFSFFPYMIPTMLMVSPAQWEKVGRNWIAIRQGAVRDVTLPHNQGGAGPVRRNDPERRILGQKPHSDARQIGRDPDAGGDDAARRIAFRSGRLDRGPANAIPSLKAVGFSDQPVALPACLALLTEKSAFADRRVRQALNFAIDRDELVKFLNGTAKPAYGLYPPGSPYFGKPEQRYRYDPEKAKALLAEPGYGPDHPLEAKVMISTSGSGQMVPLPMNEILQQQVQPVGFKLDFDVVDWGTMLVVKRTDPSAAVAHGVDALNNSLGFSDPASMFRYFSKTSFSPNGINWGHYADPRVDDLLLQAQQSFDSEQQIELLAQAHANVVDEAAWTFIVHDLNPRAMSPKVKGFQPAQSWYQDFTKVTLE